MTFLICISHYYAFSLHTLYGGRAVGVLTGVPGRAPKTRGWIPGGSKRLVSSPNHALRVWRLPTLLFVGYRLFFSGVKAARAWSWPLSPFTAEVKMYGVPTPLTYLPPWSAQTPFFNLWSNIHSVIKSRKIRSTGPVACTEQMRNINFGSNILGDGTACKHQHTLQKHKKNTNHQQMHKEFYHQS
jgi:hypothetical protein